MLRTAREDPMNTQIYAFDDGRVVDLGNRSVTVRCVSAGALCVPSGQIVVCDAGFPGETDPFSLTVDPGLYATMVTFARDASTGEAELAYVSVRFRDITPVRWKAAIPCGLAGSNSIACVMDVRTTDLWYDVVHADEQAAYDKLCEAVHADPARPFAVFSLGPDANANMLAYDDGKGDCGGGHCYGFDEHGELVCITTETSVFPVDKSDFRDSASNPRWSELSFLGKLKKLFIGP